MDIQVKIISLLNMRSELAIQEMTTAYGPLCRRIASNILSSIEDVEEVLNDTMLVAWNKIPPEQPGSLSAYLSRITRNLALARRRNNMAAIRDERLTVCLSELENCIPVPDTAYSRLERGLLTQVINTYLSTVTQLNRYIFIRRYYYLDSCGEIARSARISEQAVRTRLTRMRAELRKYLEKEGIVE